MSDVHSKMKPRLYPFQCRPPIIDPRMGIHCRWRFCGDHRLCDHVEAPHVRRVFGDAAVVMRQVVDEHRHAWRKFGDEPRDGVAFAALI